MRGMPVDEGQFSEAPEQLEELIGSSWLNDCITCYLDEYGRPPTWFEMLMWREADASCRMERA